MYPPGRKGNFIVPDTIVGIDVSTFLNCNKLYQITIPKNLMSVICLSECKSLKKIIVNKKNPIYSDIDGVLFSKDFKSLICYPAGNTNTAYTVPDKTIRIIECAFWRCKYLKNITLPAILLYIGKSAFEGCNKLKTITLSRKTKLHYEALKGFPGQLIYRD
jgi:hypothetical protein